MIKPSIGRVVWYYPNGGTQAAAGEQPHAAIVAFVHSDTCINIAYFDSNGVAKSATSVRLDQPGDPLREFPFCAWMPYQVGQAAKTEQAEKALAAKG